MPLNIRLVVTPLMNTFGTVALQILNFKRADRGDAHGQFTASASLNQHQVIEST